MATSGGGAGGRVAVYYTTSEWNGQMTAYGGASAAGYGGSGTVYVESATKKMLYVKNKEPFSVSVSYKQ